MSVVLPQSRPVANRRIAVYPVPSIRSPTATSTWSAAPRPVRPVVVGVAQSPVKGPALPLEQRVELARNALAGHDNVEVRGFDTLLAHFVRESAAACCCAACARCPTSSTNSRWRA
jgi:pantetheine-phosphate adenylyltransferase